MADFLAAIHLVWVVVLVGGTVFIYYHRWYIPYHLILVTGTLLFNLFLGGCPLTWWEEKYRRKWDPTTFYHPNSFAATYLKRVFKINFSPRLVNWALILVKIGSYYISVLLLTKLI